ncbi:MAG TPA: transcription elongation factor Spt5 [Candidatus Aenigmarchaeota archaeon]|nr:transcription elongation factor Spt5 [Candidatus Aenigmarchaeota archaeon]HDI06427.1 transcription elongation factor Spt5 [Candidatus Aenigmarchaeota archaeon]
MIIPIRVIIGRERMALDYIEKEIKLRNLDVKSILFLEDLKGYIFLEGEEEDINRAIYGAPHVRGIISKPVTIKGIKKYLVKEKSAVELNVGDIIEVLSGPFRGEKGKIVRINEAKKELTIELLEAVVPIPLTLSINVVRLIEKKK